MRRRRRIRVPAHRRSPGPPGPAGRHWPGISQDYPREMTTSLPWITLVRVVTVSDPMSESNISGSTKCSPRYKMQPESAKIQPGRGGGCLWGRTSPSPRPSPLRGAGGGGSPLRRYLSGSGVARPPAPLQPNTTETAPPATPGDIRNVRSRRLCDDPSQL